MNTHDSIQSLLIRELHTLQRELDAYEEESDIWKLPAGISNSAGTLALHLVGNLQAFVGASLGASDYERDREAEFSRRDVPRTEIIQEIERTLEIVDSTLGSLAVERLHQPFPVAFGETRVATGDFLVHLATHLAFHLGQIDYHRRLVTADDRTVGPLAISELASAGAQEPPR